MLGTTADIEAENLVINNSGQSSLVAQLGGSYRFNNCTIANYWDDSFRQDPVLLLSNTIPNSGLSEPLTQARFTNCIIYGDRDLEFLLLDNEESAFNFKFENSLLRFDDRFDDFEGNANYDFSNSALFENILLNQEPVFQNVDLNRMQIDNSSAANSLANPATATPQDILGTTRAAQPDAGAYESVDLED